MRAFGKVCATGALLVCGTGCSSALDEAALRAYVLDPANGLTQQVVAGTDTLRCSYRPAELLGAQDRQAASSPAQYMPPSPYAGKTYLTLSLRHHGAEVENQFVTDQLAYGQAISYLSTGIAQDVYLSTGQDSVPALAASYPRQYGSTGRSTVLLVFATQRLNLRDGFRVTWHDHFFTFGTVRFAFAGGDLAALPRLAR